MSTGMDIDDDIRFIKSGPGLLISEEGEFFRKVEQWLLELKRARNECAKPIMIRCECGGSYKRGEEDTRGRLGPFSQADVNIRWACDGCGHTVATGPSWGAPIEIAVMKHEMSKGEDDDV